MISKIVFDKKTKLILSVLILIIVVEGFVFLTKDNFTKNIVSTDDTTHEINVPTIYVPTDSTNIAMPIMMGGNQANSYNIEMPWPRTFVVIANSITSKKKDGGNGVVYNYGENIVMNQNREIIDNGKSTGNFIQSNLGLILNSFYPAYTKVFPVIVDSYKKLPIEIKYLLLGKSGTFCSFQVFSDVTLTASILTGNIPDNFGNMNDFLSNINNCQPNFSLPKSSFIAEHAVAYADLDSDPKTPEHILLIADNSQYGTGANCTSSATIFSIDASGKYYMNDLANNGPICYVDILKKGTTVQITKIINKNNTTVETKENFVIPADAFVLHGENGENLEGGGITYILYDKTTSTQVKTIMGRQYVYSESY